MEAKWVLAWPSGRFEVICDGHLGKHNADKSVRPPYPRCDELAFSPVRKPPECGRCKTDPLTGDSDVR